MTQVSYGTITITDTNDIESIYMVYRGAESDTTPPTLDWNSINNNQWKTDITQVTGTYIWQVTVITKSGVTIDSSNWTQFYGDPVCITGPQGIQGPQGGTGPTGKGVKSVVTYYYLSTSSSSVTGGSWSTTPQDYPSTGTKYYWTKTITTYTDDTTYESTAVYDRALTNSVKDARDANSTAQAADGKATQALTDAGTALSTANSASALATGINQHFWSLAEDISTTGGTLAAGQYITDILQSNFKQNPNSSGNLLLRSDGIYLKMGLSVLASFTSTALTFNNPSTGNAQLVIGANGTLQSGNYVYRTDLAEKRFSQAGTKIDLTNGDIITPKFRLASVGTSDYDAGAYIQGTIEALDGYIQKMYIGTNSSNRWEIGNFTNYDQSSSAALISNGTAFIQLGRQNTWRLSTDRIHTAWIASNSTALTFPTYDSKYWDWGIHSPHTTNNVWRDKFVYIRNATTADNTAAALAQDLDDDMGLWTYQFYIDRSGNLVTTGSIDAHSISIDGQSIAGGSLIAGSLASYGGTSNRPVYFPSSGTNQGKPTQITVTDNSSATAVTSTDTNLITARTLYYAGYTKNTGTVTSVQVQASSPLQSSTSTAQSTSLNTTISFINQNKNLVLAGPTTGSAAAPTFRALVAADIPDLSATYLPLTGGTVTGPVEFGDSVTTDDISTGGLVVSGDATFTNNLSVNTINGVTVGSSPKFTDNNTTYTFANGTNGFTVTPSGGNAQTVTVTPSISNNITGTGTRTADYLVKFSGQNTVTNGPKITSGGTGFLKEDGTWATPGGTYSLPTAAADTLGGVKVGYTTSGKNYKVDIDSSGNLFVNVPWQNSTSFTITANASDDDVVVLTGTSGTNAVTYSASHAVSGVTSGSYGDSGNQTPGYGSTFKVPYITVDTYGHITGISTHTVKIPASDNVDTKVNMVARGTTKAYLLGTTTAPTSTAQGVTSVAETGIYFDTTAATLVATTFVGDLTGTASGNLTSNSDLSWNKVIDRPTTLSDYGITDAKIASGTITLGSNTITPLTSSSTLSAAKLSGAIPSGVTATTQAATDNSTKIATTAYVTTAIANLPEPMLFKGTVGTNGTITSLPAAAAANEGYTYKVITALSTPVTAKVGDTVISNGTTWTVIPSGDEPSGTVTNVATGSGLTGGPISSSGTISHADTSTQASSTNSGRTYIQSISLDDFGHVTSLSTATETVTDTHNTAYLYAGASNGSANAQTSNGNTYLILVDGGAATARRKISGSGTVSVASDASGNITITGTAHPSTLPNPKTLTIRAYNSTSTTASYTDSSYYGGESSNTTISVAGTNAVTNVSSNSSGQLILTKADGTQSDPITVKITATTSDTAASADKLNISTDAGSTSTPVYFPSSTGLPTAVTSIAYSLLPVGTGSSQVAQGSHTHGNITNGGDITATAPTIASGDQIIINDHSASKITNGPTFDGSTTTEFLTKAGTWATPAGTYSLSAATSSALGGIKIGYSESGTNYAVKLSSEKAYVTVPWTDTKLTLAEVTSGTTYYPVVGSGTTAATRQYDTTGFVYKGTNGTTSTVGSAILTLGNSTASGTANNKQGQLIIYGTNAKKATITLAAPTADVALALPTASGTLSTFSGSYNDLTNKPTIPTLPTNIVNTITTTAGAHTAITSATGNVSFNVPTTAAHVGINFNYTTSGNNRAVLQDGSGNLYVTQKDNDSNVASTAVTAATSYYITGSTSSTTATGGLSKHASAYLYVTADSATSGYTELRLGNTTATTSAGGREGTIRLYGTGATYYTTLKVGAVSSSNKTITFPNNTGTVALTTDLPTITLNGTATTTPSFYAPTSAGTENYLLASNGSGAPKWIAQSTITSSNVTAVTAGAGLNTTSADTATDGGSITSSGTLYLTKSGATAGSYGPSANAEPGYGSTFNVPYVTVDKYGRVTAISTKTVKIPATDNTDEKVKQTATTGNATYEVLFSYTADNSEHTEGARKTSTLTYNPSTKVLTNGTSTWKSATSTTANTAAYDDLTLGNNVAVSSTTAHSQGRLILYGSTANAHTIQGAPTAARTITLPDETGTLIVGAFGYTTSGNNRAVLKDSSGNLYVTQKDTTYSAGTGLSLSSTTFSVKTGYSTSGNNRAVQADSNGNLYVTQKDDNTTYTFAGGTNKFTVTPSGGTAQDVAITISISNNITGSGTSGYLAKFNGANSITNGPQLGSSTTTFLRNDGSWATPVDTKVSQSASTTSNWRKVLLHYKDDASSTTAVTSSTEQVYATVGVSVQPSTNMIRTAGYNISDKATMKYDSTLDAVVFTFI